MNASFLLLALACLLLALALSLWAHAQRQRQDQSVHQHLQRSLELQRGLAPPLSMPGLPMPGLPPAAAPAPTGPAALAQAMVQTLGRRLGFGAWGLAPRTVLLLAAGAAATALAAALYGGPVLGLMALALAGLLCAFGIWRRLGKRREKLLQQLPGFLDNMVRLITIGSSPQSAFQVAVEHVPAPLGDALQQAAAMLSASPDLGQAMDHLERAWRLPEFGLLAAVFRMSTRYGGRADLVLERVAAYIRDHQSAERELHALSAEIRLSAWILALLPIAVGVLIMVLNPGYFLRMWNDASGRNMILAAAALEAFGSFLLYRLARLK